MALFNRPLGHPSSLRLDDGLAPGRRRRAPAPGPGKLSLLQLLLPPREVYPRPGAESAAASLSRHTVRLHSAEASPHPRDCQLLKKQPLDDLVGGLQVGGQGVGGGVGDVAGLLAC